jgi:hypothetical protein
MHFFPGLKRHERSHRLNKSQAASNVCRENISMNATGCNITSRDMKKSFKKSNMNRVSKREYIMEFFYYLEHPEERQGD